MISNLIKLSFLFGVSIIAMLLVAFHLNTEHDKESLLMDVFLQSLHYNHYSPSDIDDEISERLHEMYLKRLILESVFSYSPISNTSISTS